MTHIEFNNIILKNIEFFLEENTFHINSGSDSFRLGTHLFLEKTDSISVIYYYMENNGENICIQGFDAYIIYMELEKIIADVLIKSEIVGKDYQIIDRASFLTNKFSLKYDLDIITERDLGLISEEIISFYTKNALPFFEKWKYLSVLYEYIKDKESREELSEILGQFWQFKKATILRLCNDSNYQEFMDNFVKRREEILALRPDSIDVQRYYHASKELKEILDKTEPVYNR